MKTITPEMLVLIMDIENQADRHLAEKLGVSHPTIIRWRKGTTEIPAVAALAIDCVVGNGTPGSATDLAHAVVRERWQEFITGLSKRDLCSVADGSLAIKYSTGYFSLDVYVDGPVGDQVYVGDVCGCNDTPYCLGMSLLRHALPKDMSDAACLDLETLSKEGGEFADSIDATLKLMAEAERSEMLRFDVCESVLNALYENCVQQATESEYSEPFQ
jgi:hypothetical protein